MTRPPPYPAPGAPVADEEELDELGDEAIVAQQAVHSPQARVQVDMESRTIVVADEDPYALDPSEVMETRQLPQYPAANEPTPIARRSAARAPTMVLRRVPIAPPKKKRNWIVIGIWIAAGVVAFGFGGVLAVLTARGSVRSPASAATGEPVPPAVVTSPELQSTAVSAPKTAEVTSSEPAEPVTAAELPVEKPAATRPRPKPRAPASSPTVSPTKIAPAKTDIPEGI